MSGGGKGGKQTQQVKIPAWLEQGARQNMARADRLAQIGYVPYYGPDVAAFTPTQQAAFQNAGDAASAFGMAAPADPMAGMPPPQTFAGGVQGYSSAPMYEQSLAALQAARPGQFAAMQAPFVNPVTGAQPGTPFGSGSSARSLDGRGSSSDTFVRMLTGSDRSAAERAALAPHSNPGGGTGSFGLPNPMSGGISSIGGSSRPSGMGGGK